MGILAVLVGLLLCDLGVGLVLFATSSHLFQGMWLETKISKASLLTQSPTKPDFVLLGDSRTMMHFDTLAMSNDKLGFYNFGLPGRALEDYIAPITVAAQHNKKGVILSIPSDEWLLPMSCPQKPTTDEVKFFLTHFGLKCTTSFFTGVSVVSQSIWLKNPFLYLVFPQKFHDILQQVFGVDPQGFSRKINYVRGDAGRMVVTFSNGDGLIFSHRPILDSEWCCRRKVQESDRPNKLRLLHALNRIAQEHGSRLIINIEPTSPYSTSGTDGRFIDLKGLNYFVTEDAGLGKELWADRGHLNAQGVKHYNAHFLNRLDGFLHKHVRGSDHFINNG